MFRKHHLLWALAPALVNGQTLSEPQLKAVVIQGTREDLQGIADTASEGIVTSKQIQTRPLQRAGDIMESVPGLVATQHVGGGKANQYFYAVSISTMALTLPLILTVRRSISPPTRMGRATPICIF